MKRKLIMLLLLVLIPWAVGFTFIRYDNSNIGIKPPDEKPSKHFSNIYVTVSVNNLETKDLQGNTIFRGFVMSVNNPKAVKVMLPEGGPGNLQTTSAMAAKANAVAATNGGGFYIRPVPGKPLFYPLYYTVQGGKVVSQVSRYQSEILVGLTKSGKLTGGAFSSDIKVQKAGITEGISFSPQLVKNGKRLHKPGGIKGPRTAIGQKKDGSLLFLVIDGRRPGWSSGATLFELQEIMLNLGAYNAYNLDGGGSSTIVFNNEVLNKPSDNSGERRVATCWVVLSAPRKDNGNDNGSPKPVTGDLIKNGDFKSGHKDWNGSKIIGIDANGNKYISNGYNWGVYQDLFLNPGKHYQINAQTRKGSAVTPARLVVLYIDDSGKYIRKNLVDIRHKHNGAGWESMPATEFTVPGGAVKTRVFLLINGGKGNHHFDNISIKEVQGNNPSANPNLTYTVVPGDTLWAIANKFNTTVDKLIELNKITNPNIIYPGQKLVISPN